MLALHHIMSYLVTSTWNKNQVRLSLPTASTQHNTSQYSTIQYSTIQYSTAQRTSKGYDTYFYRPHAPQGAAGQGAARLLSTKLSTRCHCAERSEIMRCSEMHISSRLDPDYRYCSFIYIQLPLSLSLSSYTKTRPTSEGLICGHFQLNT